MSDTEYCRLCDSSVASAYDSYCKAHDADDEIIQLERQLAEAREIIEECLSRISDGNFKDCIRKQLKEKGE